MSEGQFERVPAEAEGVYLFTKPFWCQEDVGHLWYASPGAVRVMTLTGAPGVCFDWNPMLVEEGYLVRMKASDDLIYYLRRQPLPLEWVNARHEAEWERIQKENTPAPPSWKPPGLVKMTKKLRKELREAADPKNRDEVLVLTGREAAMIWQAIS